MVNFEELAQAMGNLEEDEMVEMLNQVMADGGGQAGEAMAACQKGMDIVGNLFEQGEYFVGDLIYAGELMTQAVGILKDALISGDSSDNAHAKMILCTVKDDLHDIGKNIVKAMLEANGFEVIDLGIDVAPETIVEKVKEINPDILGLSAMLTTTMATMKDVIDALKEEGLTDKMPVMVGGAPLSPMYAEKIGAYYSSDANDAVVVAKKLMGITK